MVFGTQFDPTVLRRRAVLRALALGTLTAVMMPLSAFALEATGRFQAEPADQAEPSTRAQQQDPATSLEDGLSIRQRRKARARARIEALFKATGSQFSCISLRPLKDSTVLDDQTIFFQRNTRTGYMNRLAAPCARLAYEDRFTYNIRGSSRLCRGEIITVLDNFGRAWGSCSLGDFDEMKRVDAEADGVSDDVPDEATDEGPDTDTDTPPEP